jgi:hypothetical protein
LDTRPVRWRALYVPAGQALRRIDGAGRFRATWTGDLKPAVARADGVCRRGAGKVSIKLKDKVVFEADGDDLSAKAGEVVRIDKGKNPLVVVYESPAAATRSARELEEQRGLRADPVPADSVHTQRLGEGRCRRRAPPPGPAVAGGPAVYEVPPRPNRGHGRP